MLRRWSADMSLLGAIAAALFVLGFGFVLAEWPELDAKDRQRGPQRSKRDRLRLLPRRGPHHGCAIACASRGRVILIYA